MFFRLLAFWVALQGCAGLLGGSGTRLPAWFFHLPQRDDGILAVGEAPLRINDRKDSLKAVQTAAFRLACAWETPLEYGLAESQGGGGTKALDFVDVDPAPQLLERVGREVVVLDTFTWRGVYHLLAWWGKAVPRLPGSLFRRRRYHLAKRAPAWISRTPRDEEYRYGLGSSRYSGALGWEMAERWARAELAAARHRDIQVRRDEIHWNGGSVFRTQSVHHTTVVLRKTPVVERWLSPEGTRYVLVRQKNDYSGSGIGSRKNQG
jgi:hypothetical protein